VAFYPKEKGPYNFEYRSNRVNANGNLLNPKQAWGGLMRNLDQTDFETGNIEFIEFWLQDPFVNKPTSTGGQLYFNLGNISEDILKDGKRSYENGLPTLKNPAIPVDKLLMHSATILKIVLTRMLAMMACLILWKELNRQLI
jgi:cell surface protein SprA